MAITGRGNPRSNPGQGSGHGNRGGAVSTSGRGTGRGNDRPEEPTRHVYRTLSHVSQREARISQAEFDEVKESLGLQPPYVVRMPLPGETVGSPSIPTSIGVYYHMVKYGFRVPLPPVVSEFLHRFNMCPAQLTPNSYALINCMIISVKCLGFAPRLEDFGEFFTLNASPKSGAGYFNLQSRPNRKVFSTPSTSLGVEWKSKFFFIDLPVSPVFRTTWGSNDVKRLPSKSSAWLHENFGLLTTLGQLDHSDLMGTGNLVEAGIILGTRRRRSQLGM